MDANKLEELERLLRAGTPGPWRTADRTMVCSLNDAPHPELLALIKDARHIFETCNVQNHICCCGSDVSAHHPMSSDHTPRDSGEYAVTKWIERFHAAFSGAKP
jgi:hypothetical protein